MAKINVASVASPNLQTVSFQKHHESFWLSYIMNMMYNGTCNNISYHSNGHIMDIS